MNATEENHQMALFNFIEMMEQRIPDLRWAFHTPNGGHRHVAVASKLKRSGVRSGVPDVLLPVCRGGYVGLAIELKVGRNKVSQNQSEWLSHLQSERWLVYVDYDWNDAAYHMLDYLGYNASQYGLTAPSSRVSITTKGAHHETAQTDVHKPIVRTNRRTN